jgi:predicted HTH transcriptional regulator
VHSVGEVAVVTDWGNLRNTPIYDTETMRFLEGFRDRELNDRQVRALAHAFQTGTFTRIRCQEINKVDSDLARQEIAAMLDLGVVQREGRGRGTRYVVADTSITPEEKLHLYLQEHRSISSSEYCQLVGVSQRKALRDLSVLVEAGRMVSKKPAFRFKDLQKPL